MTDRFVEVYAKSTGNKQLVPEHYLDHPVLGRDFELTPSARAAADQPGQPEELEQPPAENPSGDATGDELIQPEAPSETWSRARLDEFAAALDLDTTDLRTKADVLAAVNALEPTAEQLQLAGVSTTQISDDNPPSDQTPAAGENQE